METQKQENLESVKREIEEKWKDCLYSEALDMIQYGLENVNSSNRQILLTRAAVRLGGMDLLTIHAQQTICTQHCNEQRLEEIALKEGLQLDQSLVNDMPKMTKEENEELLERAGRDIEREEES